MADLNINRFFEPNPSNTGPPIPPSTLTLTIPSIKVEGERTLEPKSGTGTPTPEFSSSPISTAPSSPHSSRSALSLDDPEIRKIWEDPRFGPVVYSGAPSELNSFTSIYPYGEEALLPIPFLKEDFAQVALNPLARPFVPCFAVGDIHHSVNMDQPSMFYDESSLPSCLNVRDGSLNSAHFMHPIEESGIYQVPSASHFPTHFHFAPIWYEDPSRPLDPPGPPYPPGLPHPPQNGGKLQPLGEA